MDLILDIGNTRIKYATLTERKLVSKGYCTDNEMENLLKTLSGKLKRLLLSSVKPITKGQINMFEKTGITPQILSSKLKMPFINKYKTPETLGADRLALVAGGLLSYPNKPVLIVDLGTCLTFDFVTEQGVYLGGSISPGLNLRLKALHTLTGKLPLVSLREPNDLIGKSTNESILSGVVNGIKMEIDGIIDWYKLRYPQVKIILTGGDSAFFDKKLKNSIFADADILLKGMHFILEHNTHEKN